MHEQQGTTASKYIRTCKGCGKEYKHFKGRKLGWLCSFTCKSKYYYHKDVEASRARNRRAQKRHRQADPDKHRKACITWQLKQPDGWHLYKKARERALTGGLPFTITPDDVIVPPTCPYLGIPLERAVGKGCGAFNSPSIDRIIGSEGYTPSNIQVISRKANTMKSNATPEELVAFAKAILKQFDN